MDRYRCNFYSSVGRLLLLLSLLVCLVLFVLSSRVEFSLPFATLQLLLSLFAATAGTVEIQLGQSFYTNGRRSFVHVNRMVG